MNVRQWVAHAGLDTRPFQSGTSVNKPMRISKAGNAYVRRALFMPALFAIQHDQAVRAFYSRLLQRGKPKMKANVAVLRTLLHAIYGIFKTNTTFDPQKCFPYPKAAESTCSPREVLPRFEGVLQQAQAMPETPLAANNFTLATRAVLDDILAERHANHREFSEEVYSDDAIRKELLGIMCTELFRRIKAG